MSQASYTAFLEQQQISNGHFEEVKQAACQRVTNGERRPIIIFNDANGKVVDIDYQNPDLSVESLDTNPICTNDAASTIEPQQAKQARRVGRPKLGVVAKEVTLLPRHWEWLATQPGGASVTLRKLVEKARRDNQAADQITQSRDACYRVINALAGNEAASEEAIRALFADDRDTFTAIIQMWPTDVSRYVQSIANTAFTTTATITTTDA